MLLGLIYLVGKLSKTNEAIAKMLRPFRGKFLLKSESLLEEFIWLNLDRLLKINPLKRQYIVNKKNRTDILGSTKERSLAIIELKKRW